MLGGLLRLARQELVNEVEDELAAAGMGEVRPAQWAVTQQLAGAPQGRMLTELAAYAGMTKPSMSALVDALERGGYVERAPHPDDQRAQLVRFTPAGWRFAAVAQRAVRRVERAWAERVGKRDLGELRRILRRIVDSRAGLAEASPAQRPRTRASRA